MAAGYWSGHTSCQAPNFLSWFIKSCNANANGLFTQKRGEEAVVNALATEQIDR